MPGLGRHRGSRGSAGDEDGVFRNLSFHESCQQAGLDFEQAPITDTILEQRVGDKSVHALLVGAVKGLAAFGFEEDGGAGLEEVFFGDHPGVDGLNDGGVGDQGAEGLHQVKRQGGAAEAGLVVEAHHGIEADGVAGDGEILDEKAVGEGEESVDGVAGRAAVPAIEVEAEGRWDAGIALHLDQPGERGEVKAGGVTLDAEQLVQGLGAGGLFGHEFHVEQEALIGFEMIAEDEGALVADLAGDERAGQAEAEPGFGGEAELPLAEEDVFGDEAGGDAVEPAALGEVADGDFIFAEGLDGLGGDLDVAHEVELAEVVHAELLDGFVLVLDDEHVAGAADAEALGVKIGGAEVGARGEEAADGGVFGENRFSFGERFAEERKLAGVGVAGVPAEPVGFVGEADGIEGAAGTFGRTDEGRRDDAAAGGVPSLAGEGEGFADEFGGDGEADALAGFLIEDDGVVAGVAVVAEDDGLDGKLEPVGGPGLKSGGSFAGAAVFVIDGGDGGAVALEEVDAGDEAVSVAGEGDGTGLPLAFGVLGLRRGRALAVDAAVLELAFDGIGAVEEDALDPLIEEEAGAVRELIDHAGGEVIREARGGGVWEGLGGHGGSFLVRLGSDDVTGGVDGGVGAAEGGDDAVAAAFGGAEVDEEDLVLGVVDDLGEFAFEAGEVGAGELALEDGELEVVAPGAHDFEDAAEAFVVGDVVADEVGGAHGGSHEGFQTWFSN